MQLRQSPSGAPIVGTADGQILVWNHTTREWELGANAGALVQGAAEIADQGVAQALTELTMSNAIILPPLAAGHRYIVQAVITISWAGTNSFAGEFFSSDDGGAAASFWAQGDWGESAEGEGTLIRTYAMQAWTPVGPSAGDIELTVHGVALAVGANVFGHMHAQLIEVGV